MASWGGVGLVVTEEIAESMSAPVLVYLMVAVDCWVLDGSSSLPYLGPLRTLGMVVANSAGYFGSDLYCNSVCRRMDYNAGLHRSFVLDSSRRDIGFDYPECCTGKHTSNSQKAPCAEDTSKVLCQNSPDSRPCLSSPPWRWSELQVRFHDQCVGKFADLSRR